MFYNFCIIYSFWQLVITAFAHAWFVDGHLVMYKNVLSVLR